VVIVEPGIIVTPILEKVLGSLPQSEDSPYRDAERRMRTLFTQGQRTGGDPRVVAEVIESAITSDAPKLRYSPGPDANGFMEGRARMSDEEWIAMQRHQSDEEYFREFSPRFPTE